MEHTPVTYAYMEELEYFMADDNCAFMTGYAYEWEGENVTHLHTKAATHCHGRQSACLFVKPEVAIDPTPDVEWIVRVGYADDGKSVKAEAQHLTGEGDSAAWHDMELSFVPSHNDLYSRSKGLLEIGILEKKRVLIIGLGSFGSQIAIELAKAGVGEFALMDFDRVELHNLARHTCYLHELGRLKTDAIHDAIKGKNPYARVDRFPININEHLDILDAEIAKADIVICATDNNDSRFHISETLVARQKVGIFGRAVTRAEGGDVFRYRPGGACYCCLIGNAWFDRQAEEITNVASARRSGRIAAYVSEQDANAMVQVGLSSDIEPICNMMIKLTLVELSRGSESGISSLDEELVYDYYMWANRRERRHKNWAAMPGAGAKPTIMRWYGARIDRNEGCALCGTHIELDEGDEFEEQLDEFINDIKDTEA